MARMVACSLEASARAWDRGHPCPSPSPPSTRKRRWHATNPCSALSNSSLATATASRTCRIASSRCPDSDGASSARPNHASAFLEACSASMSDRCARTHWSRAALASRCDAATERRRAIRPTRWSGRGSASICLTKSATFSPSFSRASPQPTSMVKAMSHVPTQAGHGGCEPRFPRRKRESPPISNLEPMPNPGLIPRSDVFVRLNSCLPGTRLFLCTREDLLCPKR